MKKRATQSLLCLLLVLAGPVAASELQTVRISPGGLVLNADLVADGSASRPLSLIVHGTLAHRDMALIETLQDALDEAGRDSLAINLSLGIDNRHGHYPCERRHRHTQEDAVQEIGHWMGWLQEQGYQDVSLVGHSRGAAQAIRFAVKNRHSFRHVTLIAPPLNFRGSHEKFREVQESDADWLEEIDFLHCREARVSRESFLSYYSDGESDDLKSTLEAVVVPVLVVAGTEDAVAPGLADALGDVLNPNVAVTEIDGADHFFHDLYAYDVVDAIVADVKRGPAIDAARSLAELSSESEQSGLPVVLFVTEPGCVFCHTLRARVLYPMIRAGKLHNDVLFREVSIDPGFRFRDRSGQHTDGRSFAMSHDIIATPTLLFIGPDGQDIAKRLVGIANIELYEFYLTTAIENAALEIRRGRQ